MTARSSLYVPGNREDMLNKACQRGADALILDLEDAVPLSEKGAARESLIRFLDELTGGSTKARRPEIWVRVQAVDSAGRPCIEDLEAAVRSGVRGIVQAKAESAEQFEQLDRALSNLEKRASLSSGSIQVAALIESAKAVVALREIAQAPRVMRLQMGEVDLAVSLGMSPGLMGAELDPIRVEVVVASAAYGLDAPVAPVYKDPTDSDGLALSCKALKKLGFAGMAAIHPSQIAVINECFSPSAAEVALAEDVIVRAKRAAASGHGTLLDGDGRLVDEAMVKAARRTIASATLAAAWAQREGSE